MAFRRGYNPIHRPSKRNIALTLHEVKIVQDHLSHVYAADILTRGKILHLRNQVLEADRFNRGLYTGIVMDEITYYPSLIFDLDREFFSSECQCEMELDCQHGAALTLHLLSHSDQEDERTDLVPKLTELRKQFGSKRVDDFRELPLLPSLTLKETIQALSYINRYHSQNYFEIQLTGQNELLAFAYRKDWQHKISPDSQCSMTVKIDDQKIFIKCNNCQRETERLCEHQQIVLDNHLVQTKIMALLNQEYDYQKLVEMGAEKVGFSTETFLENFEIRLHHHGVHLYAKFDDILIGSEDNEVLKTFLSTGENSDEVNHYFEKKDQGNMMANAFAWSGNNQVFIIEGRLKKRGEALASHIKPVPQALYWQGRNLETSSAIMLAFSSDNDQIIYEALRDNLEPLSGLIHYFYMEDPYYSDKIKKKDLQPFSLSTDLAVLLIDAREEGEFISFNFKWKIGDKQISISEVDWNNSFFLGWNSEGFLMENKESISFLRAIDFKERLRIPAKDQEFVKKLLDRTRLAGNLTFDELDTEELTGGIKQIYLREIGKFLVFEPVLMLDKHRVPLFSEPVIYLPDQGRKLIVREDLVSQFRTEFKSFHSDWDKNFWPQGFAYLPLNEVMDGRWFMGFMVKAQEYKIEIYGQETLNIVQFNPNRPVINTGIKSGIDWFEAKVSISFGGVEVSQKEWVDFVRNERKYLRLNDGSLGILPEEWLAKLKKMLAVSEIAKDSLRINKLKFNIIDELFEDIDDDQLTEEIAVKKRALESFDKNKEYRLPVNLQATLRPYQVLGYQWLRFLDEFNLGGCLADDMGLGKTVQMIAFLLDQRNRSKGTSLVVVPRSLLFNWNAELDRFGKDLKYFVHHGQSRDQQLKKMSDYDLILSTYDTIARDAENLRRNTFNYIVLDESQAIKNPNSVRYKSLRLLKARNRLAMTGTPVENNTFDLYAQLSFLNPGLLGSQKSFKDQFSNPIDNAGDEVATATLQKMVHPFLLRRTKEQVAADLPEKTETILYCDMGTEQRKLYEMMRERIRQEINEKVEEGGINKAKFKILEGLLRLRQICNAPQLVDESLPAYKKRSIKIDMLIEQIKEDLGDHRALIFSQFVSMLTLIRQSLDDEKVSYSYLDGSTANRKEAVDNFMEDPDCKLFLISLKAGNTGLNLIKADYVYIVDPWWNPAVEAQAIDRTHRIGQTQNIFAYKMICKDTIEEKILQLQQKKKKLASDLIQTDEKIFKSLKKEELLALFD